MIVKLLSENITLDILKINFPFLFDFYLFKYKGTIFSKINCKRMFKNLADPFSST